MVLLVIFFVALTEGLAFQEEPQEENTTPQSASGESLQGDIAPQEEANTPLDQQNSSSDYTPNTLLYALHFEADSDRVRSIVAGLVRGQGIDLNTIRDYNGLTPLMIAVCGRQGEFAPAGLAGPVKFILKYTLVAGLGYLAGRYQEQLGDFAEYLGVIPENTALEAVTILVEYGADPYEQNIQGQTALDYALEKDCDPEATEFIADLMGIHVW